MTDMHKKTALVLGAGGFIGTHLVTRLKQDGYWVRGADIRMPAFGPSSADEFVRADLRQGAAISALFDRRFDEVYQLAADMGGAGYIFSGDNDAAVMTNSAQINLNVVQHCPPSACGRLLFTSSACVYPRHTQADPERPDCHEDAAYPADPESDYGWEKLFAERLYDAARRNNGLDACVARLHNVFGPLGAWEGGREKAPAAICRKVAEAADGGEFEIWGDGQQTRSFLYVDECVEGLTRLMRSRHSGPLNLGSTELVSIQDLARMVIDISGKALSIRFVDGPQGVRGRNSDNRRIQECLGWQPSQPLRLGMEKTYAWIAGQVTRQSAA